MYEVSAALIVGGAGRNLRISQSLLQQS